MDSIKVLTFQNIQVEYRLAGFGNRILARMIDNTIRIAYLIFMILFFAQINNKMEGKSFQENSLFYFLIFLVSIPFLFYSLIFEVFMNGQSPGKLSFQMKVASLDGRQVSLWQYILRWIFLIIDNSSLGLIPMALSEKDQRFGDLLAGTTVISTREKPRNDLFSGMEFPENYIPKYPEAYQLTEKDISILKELLFKAHSSHELSPKLISKGAGKIKEILNIESREEDLIFLQQIIKDYTFYYEKLD
jgi:uncharacterized RDD family membrane protein YckC